MTRRLQILHNIELGFSVLTVACALVWLAVQSVTRSWAYYEKHPQFEPIIRKGWVPKSYGIDLTDRQWRVWRESAPALVSSMLVCILISRRISGTSRPWFYAGWGLLFCTILHGNGMLWLVVFLSINYLVLILMRSSLLSPVWTWCFSLSLLYTTKICEEEDWKDQLESWGLLCPGNTPFRELFGEHLAFLDGYKGIYGWSSPLNMIILRIISFNIEYWRAARHQISIKTESSSPECKDKSASNSDKTEATKFSFLHFWSYALYPPLYVAGPILTYDSFESQLYADRNSRSKGTASGLKMLALAIIYALCLDIVLHFVYYHAISHNLPIIFHKFSNDEFFIPPWEIMLCGFFVLNFIYIKFLVIWRTSRALAALDGLDTTENMPRCVCNNYTFSGFWRSWHASLHAWIVRYVYLPLGGRRTQYLTVWPIFIFIGVWHDWELRWVCWAVSNAVCLIIERVLLTNIAAATRLAPCRAAWWWRYVEAGAAVANIYLLMLCNLSILYGYAGSLDFIRAFTFPPAPWAGPWDAAAANAVGVWWLLCGVLIMLRLRDQGVCPRRGARDLSIKRA